MQLIISSFILHNFLFPPVYAYIAMELRSRMAITLEILSRAIKGNPLNLNSTFRKNFSAATFLRNYFSAI